MMHVQRRAILIFLSLFILQILKSVGAQEDANDSTTDNKRMDVSQLQQRQEPLNGALQQTQPQQMQKKQAYDDEIALDYDEVYKLIEKNGGGSLFENVSEIDDYIGEEIDKILNNGPPPQELQPFIEATDKIVDGYQFAIEPAVATHPIVQAAVSTQATASTSSPSSPSSPRPPVPQVTGCKTQGQIALTYSEGPSDVTAKIARQLSKADARANFFVNATWLQTQQYGLVLQNVYNAGHLIGMTYRVKNDDPSALTDEEIRKDIINDAQIIEGLIGVIPKYLRLHYTEDKDVRTEGIIRDLGFVIVGYNLDSQDYLKKDATGPGSIQEIYLEAFNKYKEIYDAKGSFISIQYDIPHTGSLNAVSPIVNTIDQEGYTMVRLDGCLNDKNPYKKYANGTEYIGDKFSFSQKSYHQGQKAIILDAVDMAEIEEDEFKMQGIMNESSALGCNIVPSSILFAASSAVLYLLL